MKKTELVDYIENQIALGQKKEDIRVLLIQSGWQEQDVDDSFVTDLQPDPLQLQATPVSATPVGVSQNNQVSLPSPLLMWQGATFLLGFLVVILISYILISSEDATFLEVGKIEQDLSEGEQVPASELPTEQEPVPPPLPTLISPALPPGPRSYPTAEVILSYPEANRVHIEWKYDLDDQVKFVLSRSRTPYGGTWDEVVTVGPQVFSFDDIADFKPDTNYYYRVQVYDKNNRSLRLMTVAGIVTAATIPNAPTELAIDGGQLRWKDNATNEDHYIVERSAEGINFKEVDYTSFSISGRSTYVGPVGHTDTSSGKTGGDYYRVRAVNSAGYSDYSNIVP